MTILIDLVSTRLDRGTTFKKRALGGVGKGGLWRHAPPVSWKEMDMWSETLSKR